MSIAPDPNDTFELILDPTDVPMPPTAPNPPRARVQPRASEWRCVSCGATQPASVERCGHEGDVTEVRPAPRPLSAAELAAAETAFLGSTPREIAAAECNERGEHLAFVLRDVADLVAVHKITLPDALREVANRLAPHRQPKR